MVRLDRQLRRDARRARPDPDRGALRRRRDPRPARRRLHRRRLSQDDPDRAAPRLAPSQRPVELPRRRRDRRTRRSGGGRAARQARRRRRARGAHPRPGPGVRAGHGPQRGRDARQLAARRAAEDDQRRRVRARLQGLHAERRRALPSADALLDRRRRPRAAVLGLQRRQRRAAVDRAGHGARAARGRELGRRSLRGRPPAVGVRRRRAVPRVHPRSVAGVGAGEGRRPRAHLRRRARGPDPDLRHPRLCAGGGREARLHVEGPRQGPRRGQRAEDRRRAPDLQGRRARPRLPPRVLRRREQRRRLRASPAPRTA